VRLRQRLLLECSEPRRASRWSSEVSGDAAASATDARGQAVAGPVIWLVAKRNQARTADSERECTHNRYQRFIAVVLVLMRQMRTRKVGSQLVDTLSQRELPHSMYTGTLQPHALLRMSVPFELPSFPSCSQKCINMTSFPAAVPAAPAAPVIAAPADEQPEDDDAVRQQNRCCLMLTCPPSDLGVVAAHACRVAQRRSMEAKR
jgi:hypothetical protein